MPELPLSDSDRRGRERLLPDKLREQLEDPLTPCGDCGKDYPRSRLKWIYGGWVCTPCILQDDAYK